MVKVCSIPPSSNHLHFRVPIFGDLVFPLQMILLRGLTPSKALQSLTPHGRCTLMLCCRAQSYLRPYRIASLSSAYPWTLASQLHGGIQGQCRGISPPLRAVPLEWMTSTSCGCGVGLFYPTLVSSTQYWYPLALRREPCLLYTSPSPRDGATSRMPSSA